MERPIAYRCCFSSNQGTTVMQIWLVSQGIILGNKQVDSKIYLEEKVFEKEESWGGICFLKY